MQFPLIIDNPVKSRKSLHFSASHVQSLLLSTSDQMYVGDISRLNMREVPIEAGYLPL